MASEDMGYRAAAVIGFGFARPDIEPATGIEFCMRRATLSIAAMAVVASALSATPPPEVQPKPLAPAPSRPSWMSSDRNALSPPLRFPFDPPATDRPSIWQRVERDLDRSLWRVEDTPTYELNRLELERAANRPGADPQAKRDLFEYERDRQIQRDEIRYRQGRAKSREEQMRRREYELWLNDGLRSAIGQQATQDRLALESARQKRDTALSSANTSRDEAIEKAADPDARSKIQREFQSKRDAIEKAYQAERARILGVDPE